MLPLLGGGHCMRLTGWLLVLQGCLLTQKLGPACCKHYMSPLAERWTEAISGLAFTLLLMLYMGNQTCRQCLSDPAAK